MESRNKQELHKEIKDLYSPNINHLKTEKILFIDKNQFKIMNINKNKNINSKENILISKDYIINQINKRLNIYSLFSDDSLENNFTFNLSVYDNLNYTKKNYEKKKKIIYEKKIKDNSNNIKSVLNIVNPNIKNENENENEINFNDLSQLYMNNINLNFGEDPFKVNNYLNIKLNEEFFSDEIKVEISNFFKILYTFPIFKFKLISKYVQKKDFNSYIYDNNISPLKYINNIPIIIENNKLKKRSKIDRTLNSIKNKNKNYNNISAITNYKKNYDIFLKKKTISENKSEEKINNEKAIIYRYNNKFIIPLDEISFEEIECCHTKPK